MVTLENQGVVQDLATKKTVSQVLTHKTNKVNINKGMGDIVPHIKIALRRCLFYKGIALSKKGDLLFNKEAKKKLPIKHTKNPTFAIFRVAIKSWSEKKASGTYDVQEIKHLGHEPHTNQHLQARTNMPNKHSVSKITHL